MKFFTTLICLSLLAIAFATDGDDKKKEDKELPKDKFCKIVEENESPDLQVANCLESVANTTRYESCVKSTNAALSSDSDSVPCLYNEKENETKSGCQGDTTYVKKILACYTTGKAQDTAKKALDATQKINSLVPNIPAVGVPKQT